MSSRLRVGIVGAGALAFLALPLFATPVSGQSTGRYRVMVTNLKPAPNSDDDFGKDVAKELRKLINQLPTHQPVEEGEIKDAAKKFDMDMKDLDCIRSLQLATQINAELVWCGDYTENKDAKTFSLSGIKFAAPGGVSFEIGDKTWGEKDDQAAAQEIFTAFETYVQQLRVASFCGDYFNSKDWASAEKNCTQALEMNPNDTQVRYIYSRLLMETDRNEEAYAEVKKVIEIDGLHEEALQTAGYLAATMDRRDEARGYYNTYLQLNPGSASVRMQIAYDLATAGDAEGAMLLIEEGLEIEPDNVDLRLQHAAFATRAAQDAKGALAAGEPLPEKAGALYRKVLESYDVAYQAKGAEMDAVHLRNMVAAYNELGQLQDAIDMAERALQTHAAEASLWSILADVLKRSDRIDDAIAALDEVATRDPEYPNVKARQGNWLVEVGREDDALPYLQSAVTKGEQSADNMARILLKSGYDKGITPKNWGHAIRMIEMGKTFDLTETVAGELDFWHAYSLYSQALEQEKPQTLQTAQSTLPRFQQAARLFNLPRVAAYAETQPSIVIQRFRDATQQYIEIQEAIIQRGS